MPYLTPSNLVWRPVCGRGFLLSAVAFGVRLVGMGSVPALCRGVLVSKAAFLMFPDGAKEYAESHSSQP